MKKTQELLLTMRHKAKQKEAGERIKKNKDSTVNQENVEESQAPLITDGSEQEVNINELVCSVCGDGMCCSKLFFGSFPITCPYYFQAMSKKATK